MLRRITILAKRVGRLRGRLGDVAKGKRWKTTDDSMSQHLRIGLHNRPTHREDGDMILHTRTCMAACRVARCSACWASRVAGACHALSCGGALFHRWSSRRWASLKARWKGSKRAPVNSAFIARAARYIACEYMQHTTSGELSRLTKNPTTLPKAQGDSDGVVERGAEDAFIGPSQRESLRPFWKPTVPCQRLSFSAQLGGTVRPPTCGCARQTVDNHSRFRSSQPPSLGLLIVPSFAKDGDM